MCNETAAETEFQVGHSPRGREGGTSQREMELSAGRGRGTSFNDEFTIPFHHCSQSRTVKKPCRALEFITFGDLFSYIGSIF